MTIQLHIQCCYGELIAVVSPGKRAKCNWEQLSMFGWDTNNHIISWLFAYLRLRNIFTYLLTYTKIQCYM